MELRGPDSRQRRFAPVIGRRPRIALWRYAFRGPAKEERNMPTIKKNQEQGSPLSSAADGRQALMAYRILR